jgi:hypothetical protein
VLDVRDESDHWYSHMQKWFGSSTGRKKSKFIREETAPFKDNANHKEDRDILDKLIMTLADTQLFTGFSLLVSLYVDLANVNDQRSEKVAHARLVVYLCCLSSSSHLAAIVTLRKYLGQDHMLFFARLRMILITAFGLILISTIIYTFTSARTSASIVGVESRLYDIPIVLLTLALVYMYWVTILQVLTHIRNDMKKAVRPALKKLLGNRYKTIKPLLRFCVFSSPEAVFVYQVLFAAGSLGLVFAQKFSKRPSENLCGLNDRNDNQWSFGQTLAILVLFQPAFSLLGILQGGLLLLTCGLDA